METALYVLVMFSWAPYTMYC